MFRYVILILILCVLPVQLTAGKLHDAAREGNLDIVASIIESDPGLINEQDPDGRTAMHWAARGVHFDVLKYLLDAGADPNIWDNNSIAPIVSIVARNHSEALLYLLQKGAEIDIRDSEEETPLHIAAAYGLIEMVKILVENGAQLEYQNAYYRTALLLAAREAGDFETVKYLVQKGADINARDNSGNTPLILSAWRGYEELVNYLIDEGADIPVDGLKGKKLFEYALNKKLENLYSTMLDRGGDPEKLIRRGNTALHWAAKGGSEFFVRDLMERNLNVNIKDTFGCVPLHYAAKYGKQEIVEILVQNGADPNVKTITGETPISLAQGYGRDDIVQFLANNGAVKSGMNNTGLSGPWFGQEYPGNSPELFGPGIVSNLVNGHSNVTFSPDGKQACWTEWNLTETGYSDGCTLWYIRMEDRVWQNPLKLDDKADTPVFSTDGKRLYFLDYDTLDGNTLVKSIKYYENGQYSQGKVSVLPFDVNNSGLYWQFSFDSFNNLFFTANNKLWVSKYERGIYLPPLDLSELYHPDYQGGSPFISPNGDYLIFSGDLGDSYGLGDLYIGFRKDDGTWTRPVNLGAEINSPFNDHLPMVSPCGNYLIYETTRDEVNGKFWVSMAAVMNLKTIAEKKSE